MKWFKRKKPEPEHRLHPHLLEDFFDRVLKEPLSVREEEKAAFLENPCVVVLETQLLTDMACVFGGMLNATSWDEFVALRGRYYQLTDFLAHVKGVDVAENPEDLTEIRGKMEQVYYGSE